MNILLFGKKYVTEIGRNRNRQLKGIKNDPSTMTSVPSFAIFREVKDQVGSYYHPRPPAQNLLTRNIGCSNGTGLQRRPTDVECYWNRKRFISSMGSFCEEQLQQRYNNLSLFINNTDYLAWALWPVVPRRWDLHRRSPLSCLPLNLISHH